MSAAPMIPPGATIGVLGAGQLGRMLAIAAARLGYRVHICAPDADAPAAHVAAAHTRAAWDDGQALDAFAASVDVVTLEFENVPVQTLDRLAVRVPVRPGAHSLSVAQDRLEEKRFARSLGVACPAFAPVATIEALQAALELVGTPAVLKTRRMGYDGKGQARLHRAADAPAAWAGLGGQPALLEAFVAFDAEFSILLARGADGAVVAWDAPRNVHEGGVLRSSTVPAGPAVAAQVDAARDASIRMADALGHVGVMAVEWFATPSGALFNEFAPRVHNSGHWTIEAAATCQFENHVRAVCGLPLGATGLIAPARMDNLLGDEAAGWEAILREPGARLHLYGKAESTPGRKMGHVTRLGPRDGGPA
jgi:5-(carboxyamino)imidazole ribonucleotide synthase